MYLNPFTPKLPVTTRADPRIFYCLWRHQFYWLSTTLSGKLCRVKRSFKPCQIEQNSVKDTGEKGKKRCNTDLKICMKIFFHYPPNFPFIYNPTILKAFLKTFPTKVKPTKCPAREKHDMKSKKRGEERKWKVKVKTDGLLLNPKTIQTFCFQCTPELYKLIFCIWIRRPQSVGPVNDFVVSFISL